MKTEPTEALKLLSKFNNYDTGTLHLDIDIQPILELAFKEGQYNPKIKVLKWFKNSDFWMVKMVFGIYYIRKNSNSFRLYSDFDNIVKYRDTLEEAKQVCQEDFNKRIKLCLK